VKVVLDVDASSIDTRPVRATVAQLGELPRPSGPLPRNQRVAPYELTTYRVVAAVREVLPTENDGDIHVVLQDLEDSSRTLIAEAPDSACALGSRFIGAFASAYRTLRDAPRHAIVIVDGVGFFDYVHGQRGVAPNGFELHPILAIRVVGQLMGERRSDSTSVRPLITEPSPESSTKVWVNTASKVYHCQGSRWYVATRRGSYMTERDAIAAGARPAYGRRCGG
jgi:hypothetical protein